MWIFEWKINYAYIKSKKREKKLFLERQMNQELEFESRTKIKLHMCT